MSSSCRIRGKNVAAVGVFYPAGPIRAKKGVAGGGAGTVDSKKLFPSSGTPRVLV